VLVEAGSLLPTSVRTIVAKAAEIPDSEVHLEPIDVPGITGALEMAPARLAALATHAMRKCGCSVTLFLGSAHSVLISGERHEAHADFRIGFDDEGTIRALQLDLSLDGGWYMADSTVIMDRALLHADGVYRIPHLRIRSRLAQTHRLVSSCLPAEGSAQGTWAMEEVIERIAEASGIAPHIIREKNFYDDVSEPKNTPYGQPVHGPSIQRVWHQAMGRSDFEERRASLASWNRKNAGYKRGISAFPVKFGVGDPRAERNAAAVIVQILADGSVTVRAGLVDLNDGLNHQIQEEVASKLGVEESAIHVILNDFDSLPRATPVTGTDAAGLVLRALDDACKALLHRLREVALQLFAAKGQTEVELESIRFSRGVVGPDITPTDPLHFKEVIEGAWRKRVNLIETGYHRTPNLWWDPELGAGWPFSSFTYAVAVTEIQVDAFTGEIQILRLDVVHEGSPSPNQHDRDFAQLMRAYQLGHGWMLQNSAPTPDQGQSSTPDHRGVPGLADAPFQINSDRLRPLGHPMNIPGDPCGEAPVVLAGSIRSALRDALHSFGLDSELNIEIPLPATPPSVLATFKEISTAVREREEAGKKKA
jgi:xanthine dehydrogenase molybdopterin-binding subunit B